MHMKNRFVQYYYCSIIIVLIQSDHDINEYYLLEYPNKYAENRMLVFLYKKRETVTSCLRVPWVGRSKRE